MDRARAAVLTALAASLLVLALGVAPAYAAEEEETPQLVNIGQVGKVNECDSCVMAPGEWRYINGAAVNYKTGWLYLLDPNMSRVQVFNNKGEFLFTFGEEGSLGGQFGKYSSGGLAIDQETGDVYVGEAQGPFSNNRISKFSEDGKFILTFGKEVDATTEGDVCTAASGDVCQPGVVHAHQKPGEIAAAGPSVSQLTHNVLVPAPSLGEIQEFSPGGTFLQSFPAQQIGGSVEVGPENLYGQSNGELLKWSSTGTLLGSFSPLFKSGAYKIGYFGNIVLGPGTNAPAETRLFVPIENTHLGYWAIGEWTLSGELVQEHAPGLPNYGNVAVDPTSDQIYVTLGYPDGRVFALGHPITLPKPTIQPASGITSSSAVANGTVNPEGSVFPTGWDFEFKRAGEAEWHFAPIRGGIQTLKMTGEPTGGTCKLRWTPPGKGLERETAAFPYNATAAQVEAALLELEEIEPGDITVRGEPGNYIVTFEGRYAQEAPASINPACELTGGTNPALTRGGGPNVEVGNGTTDVPAKVNIGGLDPNTKYDVRLRARRTDGGGGGLSEETTFTTKPEPPVLSLVSPSHVSDSTAILEANIDPRHTATSYHFEYGTTTSYGASAPADEEGDAGSQLGASGVFEQISGLQPGTEYHFRLVAENEAGKAVSGDVTFNTYTTAEEEWPARDLELVNNPDKGAQNVFGFWRGEGVNGLSPDGTEVPWLTFAGAPGGTSGSEATFLARRNPTTGWHNIPVAVPAGQQAGNGDYFYSPAAASKDYSTWVLVGEEGFFSSNHPHVYEKVLLNGEHELIADRGQQGLDNIFVSDNGSDILYQKVSFEGEGQEKLKEEGIYDFHNGASEEIKMPECPFQLNGEALATKDFSRIFLQTTGAKEPCNEPGIYMVDRKAGTITDIAPGGQFLRTNPTGSSVVYVKQDKPADPEKEEQPEYNFYKWTEGSTECMSCGGGMPRGGVGAVVSQDLSTIYFAQRGGDYTYSELWVVRNHKVSFIAHARHLTGEFPMIPSADGSTVLFLSVAAVTPDPTGWDGMTEGTNGYGRDQLYLYRAEKGYTECISCSGTKEPPNGGLVGGGLNPQFKISGDGRTIAFVSTAALIPQDINQRPDVYEWHNGVLRLVTDGESEFSRAGSDSPWLWGLSEDGRTVVFAEGGVHITGNEVDNYTNAYAAVVGGPWFPPETPPAHCTEDSCQGPLQPPPNVDTQGSEKFRGPGNPEITRGLAGGERPPARHNKHKRRKHKKHGRHANHRHH